MTSLKNLAKQKKAERATKSKIEHPLARYNNVGQLMCILCKIAIKTDALWNTHCGTPNHKNKLLELQKQQQQQGSQQTQQTQKRKRDVDEDSSAKKVKVLDRDTFFEENTFPQQQQSLVTVPRTTAVQVPLVVHSNHIEVETRNQEEMDEENALLRRLNLKNQKEMEDMGAEISVDLDEILEVEDFATYDLKEIDKIIVEPVEKQEMIKRDNFTIQDVIRQRELQEDDLQDRVEGEIIKDTLQRRELFERMKDLKKKHDEVKMSVSFRGGAEKNSEKKKKKSKMMDEDQKVDIAALEFDFWRTQGI
jgi:zinc finger protein 830